MPERTGTRRFRSLFFYCELVRGVPPSQNLANENPGGFNLRLARNILAAYGVDRFLGEVEEKIGQTREATSQGGIIGSYLRWASGPGFKRIADNAWQSANEFRNRHIVKAIRAMFGGGSGR